MNAPIISTQVAVEAASQTAAKASTDAANAPGTAEGQGPQTPAQVFALLFSGHMKAAAAGKSVAAVLKEVGAEIKAQAGAKAGAKLTVAGKAGSRTGAQKLPQDGNSLPVMQLLEAILAGSKARHVSLDAAHLADSGSTSATDHKAKPDQSAGAAAPADNPLLAFLLSASNALPGAATAAAGSDQAPADAVLSTTLARTQQALQAALTHSASAQTADGSHHSGTGSVDAKDSAAAFAAVHGDVPKGAVAAPARPAPSVPVQQPMHKPGWGQELGSRIVWMARQNIQAARLQVNPPHLGPVEVKISIHNDSANVQFVAHHVQAREAIEAAVPRLREMMGQQGFMQTSVDVSGQDQQPQHQQKGPARQAGLEIHALDEPMAAESGGSLSALIGTQVGLGAVDYFA